jgi:hypothetical protein
MTTRTNSTIKRPGIRAFVVVAALVVAMALPAQAFAGDPTQTQYSSPTQQAVGGAGGAGGGGGVSGGGSAGTAAVTPSNSSGSLPFTGLDVIALLAVAGALTGTGFALRRLTAAGANR